MTEIATLRTRAKKPQRERPTPPATTRQTGTPYAKPKNSPKTGLYAPVFMNHTEGPNSPPSPARRFVRHCRRERQPLGRAAQKLPSPAPLARDAIDAPLSYPSIFHWDNWDNWDKSPKALPIGRLAFSFCIFSVGQHWDRVGQISFRTYQDEKTKRE